jgi:hypothetical protein
MGESTYFFTVSNNNRLAELLAVTAHQFSCQSRRRVTSQRVREFRMPSRSLADKLIEERRNVVERALATLVNQ